MKLKVSLSILALLATTEAAGLGRVYSPAMKVGSVVSTAVTIRAFSQFNNSRLNYITREAKERAVQSFPDLFDAAKELFWEGASIEDVKYMVPGLDEDTLRGLNEQIKAERLEEIYAYFED